MAKPPSKGSGKVTAPVAPAPVAQPTPEPAKTSTPIVTPVAPAQKVVPSTPTGGNTSHNHGGKKNAPPPTLLETRTAVLNMQKAIQNFANTVSGNRPPSVDSKTGKVVVGPARLDDGNKDFNDFITTSYAEQSSFKGKEAKDDPSAVTREQKQYSPLIEMTKVMKTIQNIGSPKGELKPDGKWDFRTLNALQDIAALGDAFLGLAQDFGSVFTPSFTSTELKAMRYNSKVVPQSKFMKAYAEANTRLIVKLTSFYNEVKKYILEHPAYRRQISGSVPLYTVKGVGNDPGKMPEQFKRYVPMMDTMFLKHIPITKPDGTQAYIQLPLSALKDLRSFGDYMVKEIGISPQDLKDQKLAASLLSNVMAAVQAQLADYKGAV